MASRRGQRKGSPKRRRERGAKPAVTAVPAHELKAVVERAREMGLPAADCEHLEAAIDTLEFVVGELDRKTITLARLRSLFGLKSSEKTRDVLPRPAPPPTEGEPQGDAHTTDGGDAHTTDGGSTPKNDGEEGEAEQPAPEGKAPAGHGRNGAEDYAGAETVHVAHESLTAGATCPACDRGKVYEQKHRPRVLLRVEGQAPLKATMVKLQTFRCNLCGKVFVARPPEWVGERKYDATSAAMIGLLKYGSGLPFNRLERLERNLGVPLPASTQWEVVRDAAEELDPIHEELIRQAAQGEVLHNDDTSARVLSLMAENRALRASGEAEAGARTGMFATGIVSVLGQHRVALFFTGRQHAGENAEELLRHRAAELGPPIQMCDALDRNVPATAKTLLGNCLPHGRRRFVNSAESFPDKCGHVLEVIGRVFGHDAHTKKERLAAEQRLRYHQEHSAPLLHELERWMERQLDERLVEPNSSLGDALRYMLNHWEPLTLFLRVAGAPLDNNVCERALKKFILLRKNAYFYKTLNGAHVGDAFMALIHTAELNQVNPFDYLVELLRHTEDVAQSPAAWLPWNYRERVAALAS